jgi:hypothetical protein
MTYVPPAHGFRTFLVLWASQSLSVIGSGMTGFALNVYLAQTLYPAADQKAELAFAFTASISRSPYPSSSVARWRVHGSTGWTAG